MNHIQHLQKRMYTSYRKGSDYRWVACLCASRIVGKYDRGATLAMGKLLALSVSQIENLARAGVVYRWLRPLARDLPAIRKALTPSHFSVLGEMIRKYEPSLIQAVELLRDAAHAGMSVGDFRAALDTELGGYHPEWPARFEKLSALVDALCDDYDVPPTLRLKARAVRRYMGSWTVDGED